MRRWPNWMARISLARVNLLSVGVLAALLFSSCYAVAQLSLIGRSQVPAAYLPKMVLVPAGEMVAGDPDNR